ncbi:MAG: biopolymer transporter ExbD [Flammeovirgaceae bacterium]|nr:biopolymer transporter ExbD [Flammeovirgaceae bacterium]MDW8286719.1 biopolymer transporter ExbD [Flammeovirgaceae bacterium]
MARSKRMKQEINAGSMADIAFLLLIFFLVTTTIASDKGVAVLLPPKLENQEVKIKEKNLFNILINSKDMLLADNEIIDIKQLKDKVKAFVDNNGKDPNLSDSPKDAIVSIKTDRGTSYKVYITVLDEVKKAYNELRAKAVGLTLEEYNKLDPKKDADKEKLDKAKEAYPYQVSDAEPSEVGK